MKSICQEIYHAIALALIEASFKRLSSGINKTGKRALERTSALMYFLACDAAVKKVDKCPLDLNPESSDGKNNRTIVQSEFIKLVLLKPDRDSQTRQVSELGKIQIGGHAPEKRISSNFFTVPLKKASEQSKAYAYPNRPGPVLKMGQFATGVKWGVKHHDQWKENFPKLLSDVKSNTPFFDLAVFVLRSDKLSEDTQGLLETIFKCITARFSKALVSFWIRQIEAEKIFIKHASESFQDEYRDALPSTSFDESSITEKLRSLSTLHKDVLIKRISYLENMLDEKQVKYQKLF